MRARRTAPGLSAGAVRLVARLSGLAALTPREREVLRLIAEGLSGKEIAATLGVSAKTIETHRSRIMEKLGIHKVSGLVRFAIREGLLVP